ncbi:fumarylacetoacetase [Riemerella anatipestifer]|uniref:fumarylacetoacetase n=1 Tax=Riemerella anatipestifer (strain ATCC 11845 / DSM 15868 / JCM 9532 / NCTC 11014) TaxID=693978 RepID=E4TBJ8_RIEAD|nr:fumarylacetoacetase [Riemerella anatipestifer]ADQ81827.1 fumarylacetoacetase [Riemerella anatipestifer ATCC 11845 = DSM 15868]ADZ12672.1 2-keto-4-pentenoate hydratase/2-oxohepta-3-ene-1,7-dioic acid hydratase (catechol pathway) [Riemerella anatipestifer RA-GD]AFD55837.1 fumarylacetoacetase [Riemerella anatipestifer ATCC 11845 = DSM 15868]AGC40259.1 2-keto-4-pentenoate hydratase/2-oxohepta-3-ene-1,7-dioic acid hydratase (catechol pathway) [Riemerella anatipestifer RA-CH-2]AKP69067.1 fumaryla
MKSFVNYNEQSDFSIYNIPFGVAVFNHEYIACATRIGDLVIDLASLYDYGYFDDIEGLTENVFEGYTLNDFIELGKPVTTVVRERIQALLLEGSKLSKDEKVIEECFYDLDEVEMLMPVHIPNYTDFYSSIEHATNVGKMFRDPENALLPNWKHIPVGYHGRASSIVTSGVDFHRPKGQMKPADANQPIFGASKQLDFELEMAFIVNKNTEMGESISTKEAEDSIFGMVLFNDWSARDIQSWEYVPLGPFLGKNFCSSISPWVVTLEALEPFRTTSPKQEPEVLPYLKFEGDKNFDIALAVYLTPENGAENLICQSNFKYMYWNMAQQLAHHTINGCNVEVGDMYASGTISGKEPSSFGSMLELTWRGQNPLTLSDGSERKFIEDGDTITMRGFAQKEHIRVGFGEVKTKVLPAKL